jgi:amino-acid N-acetyltransferase
MELLPQMSGQKRDQEVAAPQQRLLAACELPYQDITAAHLKHYLGKHDGGALVGVVGLELCGDDALLRSLAVAEPCRGRGLGSDLLSSAEQRAHAQGVQTLYLLTTTASRFFAAHGFREIDRATAPAAVQETTEFQTLCPDSAVCMVKRLWVASRKGASSSE